MVMFLNACIFFAIIYVKCRDRVQDQVLARVWLCLWHLGVPTNLAVVAVYAYNEAGPGPTHEISFSFHLNVNVSHS